MRSVDRLKRRLVEVQTHVTNRVAYRLFRKPRTTGERVRRKILDALVPAAPFEHMKDEMVEADIGFDADELRRHRNSGSGEG